MSNIYIQEPPTLGKVLMHTTVGDIDVELWSREAPRACKNFIQLCLEGYYSDTIFHRLVKGFIVQGGDPTGTGEGGESVYGAPFKDEFHTRLRFNRRGLLAMANAGKDDNGSQFFFTLGPAPELQSKHTIFGKVAGDTVYNMLKLAEGLVDNDERPLYPNKILSIEVLSNPFPDIVPRSSAKSADDETKARKQKDKRAAVKDFKLLSFGSEAEDDEAECEEASRRLAVGRSSKSAHDVLRDPSLSSAPAVGADDETLSGDEEEIIGPVPPVDTSNIRDKLQKKVTVESKSTSKSHKEKTKKEHETTPEKQEETPDIRPVHETQAEQLKRLREEYKALRAQLRKAQNNECSTSTSQDTSEGEGSLNKGGSEALDELQAQRSKYRTLREQIPQRGASREVFTLQLLAKFQKKLASAKNSVAEQEESEDTEKVVEQESEDKSDEDSGWMTHQLHFEKGDPVLAKDASTKEDDWFEIYDPRNPITKRRREGGRDQKGSQDGAKFRDKSRGHFRDRR